MDIQKKDAASSVQDNGNKNTAAEETTAAAGRNEDKKYRTAFYIMTGVVILLFGALIAALFIKNSAVKQIDFYEDTVLRSNTFVEETQGDFQVNINTADLTELTLLPGIGESRARDIIAYRNEYGKFTKPEDLLQIRGIGKATIEKLMPYIVFEDPD